MTHPPHYVTCKHDLSTDNVCSEKKYTKCSSVLLLRLVYFFSEQTLVSNNCHILNPPSPFADGIYGWSLSKEKEIVTN